MTVLLAIHNKSLKLIILFIKIFIDFKITRILIFIRIFIDFEIVFVELELVINHSLSLLSIILSFV